MSDFLQRIKDLPANKLALLAAQLQERLERAETQAQSDRPIAVIGVGCRLPGGADDPESYWDLLVEGRDAVREVPDDRWDADELYDPDWRAEGKMATRWGGFLDEIDRFDARLFGVSPREAAGMDPQQRLLLEVCWEALERAGIAASTLQGSPTGVFLGLSSTDYLQLQTRRGLDAIDGYLASGAAPSVAAGRIAYILGLHGPALAVDTACSSSLVAVHLAIQALRARHCDNAIAAGVNVILSPITSIALSKAQMMAADGRCKAFSAQADGFVRGEGCGVVVLKRLADAERDGDPIVGVLRGSAVNQDGRSNGLTAPNGPSQENVIAAALADAGLEPADVGYVEAHGTGTRLGDPIEVQALGAVLGPGRPPDRRLSIGSVKSNIGHLESAAGIAGLIKAMLVLEKGSIPPHLHLRELSPVIPWASLPIDVPTVNTAWPAGQRRVAGVSSFGFSGTNAHVLLEAPPPRQAASVSQRAFEVLTLSAQSPEALDAVEERLAAHLANAEVTLADLCRTVNLGRDAFTHRKAIVASSLEELRNDLADRGSASTGARAPRDHVESTRPARPVWLFTGQGAQYCGMGRELYAHEPVFADVLDRCDAFLRERFDLPLLEVMFAADDALIHQTAATQPAMFALEVALAALWRSWGVQPAAVLGHSVGEFAAAHVAGLFGLEDGLTLVATRGRLMQSLPGGGRMVALLASPAIVEAALAGHGDHVSIAAVNGPESVVISGDGARVEAVLDTLGAGIGGRDLDVSHAFHSPAVEPVLDELGEVAAAIDYREPEVPIMSNVFGQAAGRDRMGTAQYWQRHAREPVRFGPALAALAEHGHRHFLEVGPQPTLVGMASRWLDDPSLRWVPSLRKGRSELRQVATGLAALWAGGVAVDWTAWHEATPGRREILPTYPMQRERFWVTGVVPWTANAETAADPEDIDDLIYQVEWVDRAHPSELELNPGRFLAPVADVAAKLDSVASAIANANGIAAYDDFLPELDTLCAAYVLDGLARLGVALEVGARIDDETLLRDHGVVAAHRRLVRRMLDMLTEDGWLRAEGTSWVIVRSGRPDPQQIRAALEPRFPAFSAELQLVGRCGDEVAGILRGEVDALAVLFPGGSTAQMEAIYRDAPMGRTFNELVGHAVSAAAADAPSGRPLRILEVGAGSGATTESVLAELAGRPVDYVFTDISPAFTAKARQRFRSQPSMRFMTFDASCAPPAQGLEPGRFDLIVAANVVHATATVHATLANLQSLLAPGGQLVLLEATTRERFADLTVGFTPGWWAFEDADVRPGYALLSRDGWTRALLRAGFETVAVGPREAEEPSLRREAVIVASAPDSPDTEPTVTPGRTWLLVGDGPVTLALAAELENGGDIVHRLPVGDRRRVHDLAADIGPAGVVAVIEPNPDDVGSLDDLRAQHRRRTDLLLAAIQGMLDGPVGPPLWIVTRGAAAGLTPVSDPDGATAWGVGHVVELEHPELNCRRIDLGDGDAREAVRQLLLELRQPDPDEDQIVLRDGTRSVRRLSRATAEPHRTLSLDGRASYLVSGGLRGLGLLVAGWMVDHGARQLVLFGRHDPDQAALGAIESWREAGAVVVVERADAAIEADVARVLDRARSLAPLRGIVHGAGTLADAALLRQDWGHFDTVYGPKVFGTAALLRHIDLSELDFLALFSSGAGVAGSLGQANHAGANAYLDALAHHLRGQGVNAVSIDWGAWTRVGAAADRGIDSRPGAFSPEQGLAVLGYVLERTSNGAGPAQLIVHGPDWSDVLDRCPAGRLPSLYRELLGSVPRAAGPDRGTEAGGPGPEGALGDQLLGLSDRRRRQVMRTEVRRMAAGVLDLGDPEHIELGQPLNDLGLDSLMAVELRNDLGVALGAELPATLLFEHPSVNALVDHLLAEHMAPAVESGRSEPPDDPRPGPAEHPAADRGDGDRPSPQLDDLTTDDLAGVLAARLARLGERAET